MPDSKPGCRVSALHFFVKWIPPMAFWHRAHSDRCSFQRLIPGLTTGSLLESESGFEIVTQLAFHIYSPYVAGTLPSLVLLIFRAEQNREFSHDLGSSRKSRTNPTSRAATTREACKNLSLATNFAPRANFSLHECFSSVIFFFGQDQGRVNKSSWADKRKEFQFHPDILHKHPTRKRLNEKMREGVRVFIVLSSRKKRGAGKAWPEGLTWDFKHLPCATSDEKKILTRELQIFAMIFFFFFSQTHLRVVSD